MTDPNGMDGRRHTGAIRMRASDGTRWAVVLAALVCGSATATAQQEPFVGQPGSVGSFEAFDPVLADEVMTGVIPSGQEWFLFGESDRGGIYGWLNGGFVGNFGNPPSKFNGPYNAVDRANEPMANQVYFIGERLLPSDGSVGIGARADLLYGEDYILATSLGWEDTFSGRNQWNSGEFYGLAMPQLYGEVGNDTLSMKLGHFYTIVGYEGVPAVGNFFYLKSYSYMFAGPFTHWGGLATWRPSDLVEVNGGLVNGWNSLASPYTQANFLGRARVRNDDNSLASSFAIISGDEGRGKEGKTDSGQDDCADAEGFFHGERKVVVGCRSPAMRGGYSLTKNLSIGATPYFYATKHNRLLRGGVIRSGRLRLPPSGRGNSR
jgi:hypothetical protein